MDKTEAYLILILSAMTLVAFFRMASCAENDAFIRMNERNRQHENQSP